MWASELYRGTWLTKLRDRYFTAKSFMGSQATTACQLTGINSQTSMSAVKKCRAQADKNSLIFLASALVHIPLLFLHLRRTSRQTVINSDRTHSWLLPLFWQCEQIFFFLSCYLSQCLRYAVEVWIAQEEFESWRHYLGVWGWVKIESSALAPAQHFLFIFN